MAVIGGVIMSAPAPPMPIAKCGPRRAAAPGVADVERLTPHA